MKLGDNSCTVQVTMSASKLAVIAVATALVAGVILWMVILPVPRFPQPTGPYAIGTRIYSWTNTSQPEPFTSDPNDHRQLVVQIWYPALGQGTPYPYMDSSEPMKVLAKHFHIPAFLLRSIQNAPTHAVKDAAAAVGRFPVLLNPAGLLAFRSASLFWIEELTSHGYIVVGLDQPGVSAATVLANGQVIRAMDKAAFDRYMPLALSGASNQWPIINGVVLPGGIIPYLAGDVSFVLSQVEVLDRADKVLAGHMDTARAGIFGMSLGGYVAPEACHRDERFRACLAVDAGKTATVARDGLLQPLMIISRDGAVMRAERRKAGGWPEPEIAHTILTQRAIFAHNRGPAYYVTMNGMFHANWTDAPLWSPLVSWLGLAGPIDPYQGFATTNAYSLAFFDRHLKGNRTALLDHVCGPHPSARLEAR